MPKLKKTKMKKLFYILSVLFLAFTSGLSAKGSLQAANWCFGNQGQITFKSGSPVELGPSSITTHEGVATISDDNGDLLFYTDGMQVWNKNHDRMPNGWGLYGHSSSSQSGVIVPFPGNKNLYYVFTVNDIWSTHGTPEGNRGFSYSIVDLTLNNGLGDVTTKNQNLFTPSCEKITAISTYNGKGIWVLGQKWNDNKICVYLVDENGINLKNEYPIKALSKYTNNAWTKGCMKFSQKGDLLAVANNGVSLALYNFNVQTGVLSNERYSTIYQFKNSYGVEFSPNSKYLYVSSTPFGDNESYDKQDYSYLLQVDLEKAKTQTLDQSYNVLAKYDFFFGNTEVYMGSLQLALDNKIYLATLKQGSRSQASRNFLSVINNPNDANCNYVYKGLPLINYSAFLGLPTFIQSFFRPDVNNFVTTDFCDGEDVYFHSDYYKGMKYKWTGPNGFAIDTCDTVIIKPDRSFAGTYKLFVTDTFGFTDTSEYIVNYHKTDISMSLKDTVPVKYIHGSYQKTITITNNYTEAAVVDSLYLKSGRKYTIENVSFPFAIYGNEVRNYKVLIDARLPESFKDTIVLQISRPCPYNAEIAISDSIRKIALHIVLPDTIVDLGTVLLSDIKAYLEPKTGNTFTFDLDFTYSYLSYLYSTYKTQKYPYTKEIFGVKDLYTLQFPQLVMNDTAKTLTSIRGITLLCNDYITPLEFTNCTLSDSAFEIVLHNGKIQVLKDGCPNDYFTIKGSSIHVAYSQPAPLTEGGKILLFSPDKGTLKLSVYSSMGDKIEEMNFESNGTFAREIEPDLTKYSNGLYTLIWESNNTTFRKIILINK